MAYPRVNYNKMHGAVIVWRLACGLTRSSLPSHTISLALTPTPILLRSFILTDVADT